MALFGGEKYNKEEYDTTQRLADEARKSANAGSESMQGLVDHGPSSLYRNVREDIHNDLQLISEFQATLSHMRELAQKEGSSINQEYDKLLERAQDAIQRVHDFEKEKLGMHSEEQ